MQIDAQKLTEALLALANGQEQGRKQNLVPPHGNTALLNDGSVNRDLYSAMLRPPRLAAEIPIIRSRYFNENYLILTGQTAPIGTNPEPDQCNVTGATAGNLKTCKTTYNFGEFKMSTKPFDITQAPLLKDRQDMEDFSLNNTPFADNNPFLPDAVRQARNINSPRAKGMMEFGYEAAEAHDWTHMNGVSTRTGASARLGFPREYNGLLQIIRTGYVDADTSEACPAADSQVIDGNDTVFDATTVDEMIKLYRRQTMLAEDLRMGNVTWGWIMHPFLQFQLFDVWACNYATVKCNIDGNDAQRVDITNNPEVADMMRRGSYVMIDGQNVPVIFSWSLNELLKSNQYYTAPILLVAFGQNGTPLLFYQYLPYDQQYVSEYNEQGFFRVMNRGFYFMKHSAVNDECVQYTFKSQGRLIHRAPFLCGKIENILFQNTEDLVSPYRGSSYYRNGGQYKRT